MALLYVGEMLGGSRVLKRTIENALDLDRAVEEGLPARSLEAVMRWMEIGTAEMSILFSARVLERTGAQDRLSSESSDRLIRLARAYQMAEGRLASMQDARNWMLEPNVNLGGKRPIELVRRSSGSMAVTEALLLIPETEIEVADPLPTTS